MNRLRAHTWKGILLAAVLLALPLLLIACGSDDDDGSKRVEQSAAGAAAYGDYSGVGQSGIRANGSGQVAAAPDIATIRGGVNVTRATVAQALSEAAELMDTLLQALIQRRVAERDIQTTSYNIYPEYRYDHEADMNELVGYRVSNEVSVTVKDLGQVGALIDDMARAGGNDTVFHGVSFGLSDPKPLEVEARQLAVEDLIDKAEQLADNAGVTLGDLIYLDESSRATPRLYAESAAMMDGSFTPIQPGALDVVINVTGVFGIE